MFSYQRLAASDTRFVRLIRAGRVSLRCLSLPTPRLLLYPLRACFTAVRAVYYFVLRVFICEPLFKSYCLRYGESVHTDVHIPFVKGRGNLIVGDHVLIDGKISISFAARYAATPELVIGSHTGIGHNCSFTVGKRIVIGDFCRISSVVFFYESSGHPTDPATRRSGVAAHEADVRPITVGNNVWIGRRAIISPGVSIGDNSVIAAGAVVLSDVPRDTMVAGNPARQIARLDTSAACSDASPAVVSG